MRTRKFKKTRVPRRVFLVICEGETEEAYVNILKRHFRLPITIKTKISGNAINKRLVAQYVQELGVSDRDEYQIFYVYDSDVIRIVEKLISLPEGIVILSNPCIELWYLLHHKEYSRLRNSKEIVKDLTDCGNVWKNYSKGFLTREQQKVLLSNCEVAMARSRRLKWHENPSTNMHQFIEALKAEKQ